VFRYPFHKEDESAVLSARITTLIEMTGVCPVDSVETLILNGMREIPISSRADELSDYTRDAALYLYFSLIASRRWESET
jgi:hypothetical protein